MATTKYNALAKIDETIKVAEKALFEATRAHERLNALPLSAVPETPQRGERGERGIRGFDGKNGADGRDAVGKTGATGVKGDPGKDGRSAPDLSTIAAAWRQDLAAIRTENAELRLMLTAMLSQNSKSGEYLKFLREQTHKILAEQAAKRG